MRGHIRRRGRRWYTVVFLGKTAEGKSHYKWTPHDTRQAAEEYLVRALGAKLEGRPMPARRERLGAFLERWLRGRGDLADSTRLEVESILRRWILPELGHIYLNDLGPLQIQTWAQNISGKLAPSTVFNVYKWLRSALHDAVDVGLLLANPAERHRQRYRRTRALIERPAPRLLVPWDEEHIRLFLAAARRLSPHWLIFKVALLTGLRRGELFALRWADVDFPRRQMMIIHTVRRVGRVGMVTKEPKTYAGRRPMQLSPQLIRELRAHQARQDHRRMLLGAAWHDHGLVFCKDDGAAFRGGMEYITREHFHRLCQLAGVPQIHFHDLRHTHATHFLASGGTIKGLQERLGHSNPGYTLQVYTHVLPPIEDRALQRMERRLLGQSGSRRMKGADS